MKKVILYFSFFFFYTLSLSVLARPDHDIAEQKLIEVINNIQQNRIDQALQKSRQLIQQYPKFQLARLIYADLLNAQTGAPVKLERTAYQPLVAEAKARLQGNISNHFIKGKIPQNLILIPENIHYILQFDLSLSRLYLFQNQKGHLELINSYYISQGKQGFGKQKEGDNKTPIGVYQVTQFLKDEQLPELYGWGAFPINYPNTWDKMQGKTGHGIWLHGIPRTNYSRPPKDSEGCVVLNNKSLAELKKLIRFYNTPVILSRSINWIPPDLQQINRDYFKQLMEQWADAWKSKDINRYLSFYSKQFNNRKKNYQDWKAHKTRVIGNAGKISLKLSQHAIYQYPVNADLLYTKKKQKYASDTYKGSMWKEQFWKKEKDGKWRIIYEGKG